MSGEQAGTSGAPQVTSGGLSGTSSDSALWRWFDDPRFGPLLTAAAIGFALALVNGASVLSESHGHVPFWAPFLWEFSSVAMFIAMAPVVGAAVRRWPPQRERIARFALTHVALTIPFSLIHVAGIFAIRATVHAAMGQTYAFFDHGVAARFIYEWRKDVLVYAAIALIYALFQSRRAAAPRSDERIAIREGATALFLAPRDVLWLEAAGNYVEFHTAKRTHLVRGTLSAWEQKLTARGFARAHRSRLVNRARIAAIKPTASGDVEIALDDGRTLLGSRRYRAGLAMSP